MTTEIINQYQIKFNNTEFKNTITGEVVVNKIPTIGHLQLFEFLIDWQNAQEINTLLLPDINSALANSSIEFEKGSEVIAITIKQNNTDFFDNNGYACSIPTLDFKEIIVGWRDFLLVPPFHGSKA